MSQKQHADRTTRAPRERQSAPVPVTYLTDFQHKPWKPDGPTVRFHELLKVVRFGRSTAYKVFKNDPTFPKGTPLFDTPRSPRFWWYDQVIAWLRDREAKANANTNININKEHEYV